MPASTKTKASFVGGVAVVAVLALQAVERWTVVDAVLAGLRHTGPVGAFFVNMLMSRSVPLILAIAAIYLGLEGRKEREESARALPLEATDSHHQSQSVGNSGNITQQVFVAPERELKPTLYVQEEEEPPRLDFVQPKFTFVNESEFHVWNEVEEPMPVNNALIAEFKNAPKGIGQQTSKACSVVAMLVFVGRGNPRELHVAHGTWLREYTHFVTFKSGQTHKLIIALNAVRIKRNSTCFVTLSNPRASNPFAGRFRSGYTIHPLEALDLPEPTGEVHIALVDGSGITVFDGRFDYTVSDDEMMLKPLRGVEPSKGHL